MLLDCYSDLLLAWEVLNVGGLMAIDDYFYKVNDGILVSPHHAVNKILEKYKDNIKILNTASRVFVQKV